MDADDNPFIEVAPTSTAGIVHAYLAHHPEASLAELLRNVPDTLDRRTVKKLRNDFTATLAARHAPSPDGLITFSIHWTVWPNLNSEPRNPPDFSTEVVDFICGEMTPRKGCGAK